MKAAVIIILVLASPIVIGVAYTLVRMAYSWVVGDRRTADAVDTRFPDLIRSAEDGTCIEVVSLQGSQRRISFVKSVPHVGERSFSVAVPSAEANDQEILSLLAEVGHSGKVGYYKGNRVVMSDFGSDIEAALAFIRLVRDRLWSEDPAHAVRVKLKGVIRANPGPKSDFI